MSSQLTLFNSFSNTKSEKLILKDIEVLIGRKHRPWFKWAYTGQYLGIPLIIILINKLVEEGMLSWSFRLAERGICSIESPKEVTQDHNMFISLTGALCVHILIIRWPSWTLRKIKVKHSRSTWFYCRYGRDPRTATASYPRTG